VPAFDTIGYLAAMLTTCAFVPQAHMAWKTKRTDGISVGMYAIFIAGVALWLAYGLLIGAWPVIVANIITLTLAVFILVLRLRYGDRPK
jgi:MtN3 and saliva related transmembrane protein